MSHLQLQLCSVTSVSRIKPEKLFPDSHATYFSSVLIERRTGQGVLIFASMLCYEQNKSFLEYFVKT